MIIAIILQLLVNSGIVLNFNNEMTFFKDLQE
nr:MAG TPA: hypothetical protein [Crassvirales sp.]